MAKFYPRAAQRLLRAILCQAILDAFNKDESIKADAERYLQSPDSDAAIMAQGVTDVDAFRAGLRKRMAAAEVNVNVEGGKWSAVFTQSSEEVRAAA